MTDIGTTFRDLHIPGDPFVMVNVWDIGTARMMAGMGAKALATSSAAHAFTLGKADGGTLTRDAALAHAQDIVAATDLPVQGDFENGFGDTPETCAETVRLAAEVGLAGICIEDIALPDNTAYDTNLAIERIRAAAAAARALPQDFVLTARADGIMCQLYDVDETIARLQGFATAGADCLYAPVPRTLDDLATIIRAVDKPVNALAAGAFAQHSLSDYAKIGAARISIGGAMARVAHRAVHDTATALLTQGDFSALSTGLSGDLTEDLLAKGAAG